jgi:hypothetical protein
MLREIRGYLQENGFRWDAFINGSAVQVEVISGSEVLVFTVRNMKQARWVVRHYA